MSNATQLLELGQTDPALLDAVLHSHGFTDAEITEIFSQTRSLSCSPEEFAEVYNNVAENHNKRSKT